MSGTADKGGGGRISPASASLDQPVVAAALEAEQAAALGAGGLGEATGEAFRNLRIAAGHRVSAHRPDAGEQFVVVDRFDQVVERALAYAPDLVGLLAPAGVT